MKTKPQCDADLRAGVHKIINRTAKEVAFEITLKQAHKTDEKTATVGEVKTHFLF